MRQQTRISDIVNDCNLGLCVTTYVGESLASILKKICTKVDTVTGDGNECCYIFEDSPTITWLIDGSTISGEARTVVDFDAGNLAPLFTTNVATSTTTPFLSFSINSQTQNEVFAAPSSGNGLPDFRLLVMSDMPFTVDDFIQNQILTDQLANFWISGVGRVDGYLQIDDSSRIVKDITGVLSITQDTSSTIGDHLRVRHLKFFDDVTPGTAGASTSEIYAAQGDNITLSTNGQFGSIRLNAPFTSIGTGVGLIAGTNTPILSPGGFHPLVIMGSDGSVGNFSYLDVYNANEAGLSADSSKSRLVFSHNKENGSPIVDIGLPGGNPGDKHPFGAIGVEIISFDETSYKGDMVFEIVDGDVNTGDFTEMFRLKYDGRMINPAYSTLLSAPTTNGVKHMVTTDEDGLLSHEPIPVGAAGSVTSVALSFSGGAWSVANSPITNAGTFVVTSTGTTSEYIRGDGSLATFVLPISSMSAAAATNTIDNTNFFQTWNWSSLAGPALTLGSTSSSAAGNLQVLFAANLSGANVNAGQLTTSGSFFNTHTGTGSTNVAGRFQATGADTNIAGRFYADGGSDNRAIWVQNGNIKVDTISNALTQDRIIGQTSSTGVLGYLTLGTSLSISSGVLQTAGAPLSGLTAATANNNINNGNFNQVWRWDGLTTGTGLSLTSNTTAASGTTSTVFKVSTTGANVANGVHTTAADISSTHSGTNSFNEALKVAASGAFSNSGILVSIIDGVNGVENTGIDIAVQGASGSDNIGLAIAASGGNSNTAIVTSAGDVTFDGGDFFLPALSVDPDQDYLLGAHTFTLPQNKVGKIGIGQGLELVGGVLSVVEPPAVAPGLQSVLDTSSNLAHSNTITQAGTFTFQTGASGFRIDMTGGFANIGVNPAAYILVDELSGPQIYQNTTGDFTISVDGTTFFKIANYSAASNGDVLTLIDNVTGEVGYAAGGGGGGVTTFSAGTLSPLFTTSVATATSTPALSFILTNAAGHTYFGNDTGSAAAPAYKSNAAFVRVNDTNVTMTLTGAPTTALLETMTATLGWTGTLGVARGGTNLASYTTGDLPYASGATTLSKLGIGTAGQILRVNAGATAPEWYTQTFNSGTVTSFSAGDLSPLFTTVESTVTTTPSLAFTLTNAGPNSYFGNATGGSAAPSYTAAGALTTVNDTNVLLTVGGNAATSLLRAASITASWNGTLSVARGGTAFSSYAIGDIMIATGATTLSKITIGGPFQQLRVNAGGTSLEYFTAGAGLTSLNGLTPGTQLFAVGTSGSDFNISSVTDTHTFNIPSASLTARGLVTTAAQSFEGIKTFNVGVVINESGAASNFRVESDTNINAILVDATTNRVGILGSPSHPFDVTGDTRITGSLGISTPPSASAALNIGGTGWTSTGALIQPSVSVQVGGSASIVSILGTLVKAASGTSSVLAGLNVSAPNVTAGASTVSLASTVYVGGPLTGGVINAAFTVASGASRFGGDIILTTLSAYSGITTNRELIVRNISTQRFESLDPDIVPINTQSGASYTIGIADKGTFIPFTNASLVTITIPANATTAFPIGTRIEFRQGGAGKLLFTPAGGVTLVGADSAFTTRVIHSNATLTKEAINTWSVAGDLIP